MEAQDDDDDTRSALYVISDPFIGGAAGDSWSSDEDRYYAWGRGDIDYMGVDSFDNILKRIDKMMTLSDVTVHMTE